jgi:fluoroacetyl-CoA thioesterase
MKDSLKTGIRSEFKFKVPENKTVPYLLPESPEFQQMPQVLASGFMLGLIEWACIQALNPYLDWPREQSVGTGFNLDHSAPTPPGLTVTIRIELIKVEGRKLTLAVEVDDGIDKISVGTHERFVIDAEKFNRKAEAKLNKSLVDRIQQYCLSSGI